MHPTLLFSLSNMPDDFTLPQKPTQKLLMKNHPQ
jgi:hypothetical protein